MLMLAHAYGGQRLTSGILSQVRSTSFYETGSPSFALKLLNWLAWLAGEHWGAPACLLPSTAVIRTHEQAQLFLCDF